jgi:hypothetical protein
MASTIPYRIPRRLSASAASLPGMTSTHFMNLFAAIFIVVALAVVCRLAFHLSGRRYATVIARDERSDPSQR